MNMIRSTMILAALMAFPTFCANAQPEPNAEPRFTAKVLIDVSFETRDLEDQVRSFMGRELRSLRDVVLVSQRSDRPDYILEINGMQDHSKSGVIIGYSMAVAIEFLIESDVQRVLDEQQIAKNASLRSSMSIVTLDAVRVMDVRLMGGGSTEDLQEQCRKVIARFDATQLEGLRAVWKMRSQQAAKAKQ